MSKHAAHHMHGNSLAAYASTDFSERERQIIAVLSASSVPLTAREIAGRLGFADLNMVRPRLNELKEKHIVGEAEPVKCTVTGKLVATFALVVPVQMAIA